MKIKLILFAILVIIPFLIFYQVFFSREVRIKDYERSVARVTKQIVVGTQESYKAEFKEYIVNSADLKSQVPEIDGSKIFYNKIEVTPELSKLIENDDLPYLENTRYSILIFIEKRELNYSSIWKLNHKGDLVKIYQKL